MEPVNVDDVSMAFGAMKGLMPDLKAIPLEFHQHNGTWGNKLFNDWFYCGVSNLELTAKEGIDKTKALRHIKTIMGSFSPAHEDKEAAVAYLLDHWFEPGKWETKPFRPGT